MKKLYYTITLLAVCILTSACTHYEGPEIKTIDDASNYLKSISPTEYGWYYITDYDKPLEERKEGYTVYTLNNKTKSKLEAFAKAANKVLGKDTIQLRSGQFSYQQLLDAQIILTEHADELNWWSVGCDIFSNRVKYSTEKMTDSYRAKIAELVPLEIVEIYEHAAPVSNSEG